MTMIREELTVEIPQELSEENKVVFLATGV